MGFSEISSPAAIMAAVREHDRIGQDAFLDKYGFGQAGQYFLICNGSEYDSKAIIGAAHGYQFPERGPLRSTDFSGGDRTVRELLNRLGFDVLVKAPSPYKASSNSPEEVSGKYGLDDLAQSTGLPHELLRKWTEGIRRKRQAILYGPPGTGKTWVGEQLARFFTAGGDGFVEIIQFHPAYGYEDFIFGIRPSSDAEGSLVYDQQDGRFVQFCERARSRKGVSVLIIDEINRANLSEVFGELMYLLEYRERTITLAGGRSFAIPENVVILGTMNTADRSIALMDYALRRRFAFLRLDPQYDLLRNHLRDQGLEATPLVTVLQEINASIGDPNYALGVSFFLQKDLRATLETIWQVEIYPYIEEYFFDQVDRAERFSWPQVAPRLRL